ncbi:MAG: hypothetical protein HY645_02720 [Acidobacteria bacterium]|nr:hypothetical protein [Acidobacteriota bacterium]
MHCSASRFSGDGFDFLQLPEIAEQIEENQSSHILNITFAVSDNIKYNDDLAVRVIEQSAKTEEGKSIRMAAVNGIVKV